MEFKKISDLPENRQITGEELFEIEVAGSSARIKMSDMLAEYIKFIPLSLAESEDYINTLIATNNAYRCTAPGGESMYFLLVAQNDEKTMTIQTRIHDSGKVETRIYSIYTGGWSEWKSPEPPPVFRTATAADYDSLWEESAIFQVKTDDSNVCNMLIVQRDGGSVRQQDFSGAGLHHRYGMVLRTGMSESIIWEQWEDKSLKLGSGLELDDSGAISISERDRILSTLYMSTLRTVLPLSNAGEYNLGYMPVDRLLEEEIYVFVNNVKTRIKQAVPDFKPEELLELKNIPVYERQHPGNTPLWGWATFRKYSTTSYYMDVIPLRTGSNNVAFVLDVDMNTSYPTGRTLTRDGVFIRTDSKSVSSSNNASEDKAVFTKDISGVFKFHSPSCIGIYPVFLNVSVASDGVATLLNFMGWANITNSATSSTATSISVIFFPVRFSIPDNSGMAQIHLPTLTENNAILYDVRIPPIGYSDPDNAAWEGLIAIDYGYLHNAMMSNNWFNISFGSRILLVQRADGSPDWDFDWDFSAKPMQELICTGECTDFDEMTPSPSGEGWVFFIPSQKFDAEDLKESLSKLTTRVDYPETADFNRWNQLGDITQTMYAMAIKAAQEVYAGIIPQMDVDNPVTVFGSSGLLSLADSDGSYEVLKNGYIVVVYKAILGVAPVLNVNGEAKEYASVSLLGSGKPSEPIQVNAGDVITATGTLGLGSSFNVTFYPNKTAE